MVDGDGQGFRFGREVETVTVATERMEKARPRRFRRYPEYKDSGIEWLGEIPAHWEVKRLKTMALVQLSNVDKKSEEGQARVRLCNYVDVYYNDRITTELEFMNSSATGEQVRRFELGAGDVLITKDSESWNDIAVPAVVAEDLKDVLCGYHLAHIKPRPSLNGRFLARQFSAIGLRDQFHVTANGITRFGLSGSAIRTGLFPIAPIKEQRAIAAFLDRETAKIDGLVQKKERLIELLKEKRTALITRAVTRGLDPNVPMKDPGVEWLGKIPAHWDPARLWRLCTTTSGATPTKENPAYWNGEVPWVSPKDMKRRVIATSEDLITQQALDETGIKLITPHVVLVVVRGMILAHSFPVAVTSVPVTINQDMKALRLIDGFEPFYFAWALDGLSVGIITTVVEEAAHGTRAIRMDQWRNLIVPVPPRQEQRAITAFLDRETAKIDALIAKIRQAINHLKEFRTALISAAVTGRIDVRSASAETAAEPGGTS